MAADPPNVLANLNVVARPARVWLWAHIGMRLSEPVGTHVQDSVHSVLLNRVWKSHVSIAEDRLNAEHRDHAVHQARWAPSQTHRECRNRCDTHTGRIPADVAEPIAGGHIGCPVLALSSRRSCPRASRIIARNAIVC